MLPFLNGSRVFFDPLTLSLSELLFFLTDFKKEELLDVFASVYVCMC